MGSLVGITKKLCLEKNINDENLDVKNLENFNTINSNKNEQTKNTINENYNNNIEEVKNNEDNEEEEEEEENEDKDNHKEQLNNEMSKYKNDLSKIILIQKTFKRNRPSVLSIKSSINKYNTKYIKLKDTKKVYNNIYDRFHTINFSTSKGNILKKTLYKYEYNIIKPEKIKSGKDGNKDNIDEEEEEEIISVEQPYRPMLSKKSSNMINNFKAMNALKSSIIQNQINQENNKQNLLKVPNDNQHYLRILSDFGERRRSFYQKLNNEEIQRGTNLVYLLAGKEKKDKNDLKIKTNQDNIKGNFMLKNEKVIRYRGGFIKKTKKKNGFGIVTWSDNSTLHGIYLSSTINGLARFYNNKYKSTFIGEYIDNLPKGFGVYSIKSVSLQGYWDNSNLNGIAIEVWDDGTYFQGEYENNYKNGVGLYRWPDGTIYQGEFKNGQMTGRGIIYNCDDSIFYGEMLNGYMNGYGVFSWGNGALYMGYYLHDIKHGFGIYVWDTKMFVCYIGFWEMGKQQGVGAKVNGNKIKYAIWNKGKIAITLKGLYEIDRYLAGFQKGYYHFFTPGYIGKLRANNFYYFNPK